MSKIRTLSLIALLPFVLGSCFIFGFGRTSADVSSGSYSFEVLDLVAEGGGIYEKVKVDVGSTPKEIYFIFTNPTSDTLTSPGVYSEDPSRAAMSVSGTPVRVEADAFGPVPLRDRPSNEDVIDLREYTPRSGLGAPSAEMSILAPPVPLRAIGDPATFYDFAGGAVVNINTKLRAEATVDGITTNIWVADDQFGAEANVSTANANALLSAFLNAAAANDVYELVSNILGAPWGTHNYPALLLDPSAASQINIVVFDIDNEADLGGVVGFFWAKDNFLTHPDREEDPTLNPNRTAGTGPDYYDSSNKSLVFYLDSFWVARYMDDAISTLAHEFQHMIHYYQHNIVKDAGSDTWVNEMASMVAEDLVAEKIGIAGPRGFLGADAGSYPIPDGRLPRYNYYNDLSLSTWYGGNDVLTSYSLAYAFGAFLTRAVAPTDAADFFRDVVQSNQTGGENMVNDALAKAGVSETVDSLLDDWAMADILSDSTDAPADLRMNSGDFFVSGVGSISDYELGSINMYNYEYVPGNHSGPYLYDLNQEAFYDMPANSKAIFRVAIAATGSRSYYIYLPAGATVTVLGRTPWGD